MTDTIQVVTEQIAGPPGPTGPQGPTGDPSIAGDDTSFGASDPILSRLRRSTTTDGTTFSAWTYDLAANAAVDLTVTIFAKDQATGGTYSCDHRVRYSRNGSAGPAIQGSLVSNEQPLGSLLTASSTVDFSGNTIRVRINPVNGVTTKWSVAVQAQQVL